MPPSDIKNTYRRKSLLIHPDKTRNPSAPDAFDRLKKAVTELQDEAMRARLDESIADARMLLMRERKLTVDSEEVKSDEFRRAWREKTKVVLVDNEARRRRQVKAQMQEEGREKRKEEEELDTRKRKREQEQRWEESREERISSWRDFAGKAKVKEAPTNGEAVGKLAGAGEKKKKKKLKVLG